ncbi:enolase 4 isoform X1 [Astyanax mexicanus]|uniref:Enolase 4 n=1 Tax=Astyanax mexicanus TaxID=7994 RepID=A0A8T2LCB0_ASTMX|nr:enolase 4 isoform X1 [Astyanax mexicanus]
MSGDCCRATAGLKQSGERSGARSRRSNMSYKSALKAEQELYELKSRAAEYYRANRVPHTLEELLNQLFAEKPSDIYGYMANYFSRLAHTPVISSIAGREVYDSRGEAALQVDVYCMVRNEEKLVCSAVNTGLDEHRAESGDAVADDNHQQASVATALEWIREQLSSMLCGFNPAHQTQLDKVVSDFLMARYLEEQDAHNSNIKSEEEEKKIERAPEATPPPQPAQNKDKKGEKGKKRNSVEKLIPPLDPPPPVLPGAVVAAAVSLAAAKSAASLTAVPLYRHIITLRDPQALSAVFMPIPLLTVLSCGKASAGKLNLLEELILLPTRTYSTREIVVMGCELQREIKRISTSTTTSKTGPAVLGVSEGGALQLSLERSEQALDLLMEACVNLKLPMGTELRLAINCAAHKLMDYAKGKYEVMAGTLKSPDELVDMYVGLVSKYPSIAALINPFRKEDEEQWLKLSSLIGHSCCLVADAAYSPGPCWRDAKPLPQGVTWVTLRHGSEMTLTDLLHTVSQRAGTDGETILAVSSEEIGDDSMVDVAVGVGVTFIKLGGLSGGSRMNKYNRLQSIELELQEQGILAGMRQMKLPWEQEEVELNPEEAN